MNSSEPTLEAIAETAARWVSRRDAGLTSAERAEFECWRDADARHEAALRHYDATWARFDRSGRSDAILRELGVQQAKRRRRRQRVGAAALALALLGSVGLITFTDRPAGPQPIVAARPGGLLLMPEQRALPDGSVVDLKGGAEIRVDFSPGLRRVELVRGEAHFRVAKDRARPFAVEAGGVQVRAVGTAFAVQRNAAHIEVVVTEGRVALARAEEPASSGSSARTPAGAPSTELAPLALADAGQRVVVPAADLASLSTLAVVPVSADEIAERLAWRAPRVEFSATPLSEALAMMSRATSERADGVQMRIDPGSAALGREPISGVFRADNAEAFVRMLELSLGVQAERRGNQIVLRQVSRP